MADVNNKINLSKIIDLYNNDSAKVLKILLLYNKMLPDQIEQFNNACHLRNLKNLNALSHTLKTTFRYLGSVALSNIAKEIEMKSLDANFDPCACESCMSLMNNFKYVLLQINEYITQYE